MALRYSGVGRPAGGFGRTTVAALQALRPRQWTKNVLVGAALVFSEHLTDPVALGRTVIAVGLFCLLSGAIYIANDIYDAAEDRRHPRKRLRPIASGILPIPTAWILAALLTVVGLVGAAWLSPNFGLVSLTYVGLQITYTYCLKHMVLLDAMAIAAGFVLRAVAGATALGVLVSPWLLICTVLLALLLALGKRRGELMDLSDEAGGHRVALTEYSVALLDQLISTISAATIIAYALYTFFSPTSRGQALMWTLPFVIYLTLAVYFGLRLVFGSREPYSNNSPLYLIPRNFTDPRAYLNLLLLYNVLWVSAWRHLKERPQFLVRQLGTVLAFLVIHWAVGIVAEVRLVLPTLPILVPLGLMTLAPGTVVRREAGR